MRVLKLVLLGIAIFVLMFGTLGIAHYYEPRLAVYFGNPEFSAFGWLKQIIIELKFVLVIVLIIGYSVVHKGLKKLEEEVKHNDMELTLIKAELEQIQNDTELDDDEKANRIADVLAKLEQLQDKIGFQQEALGSFEAESEQYKQ